MKNIIWRNLIQNIVRCTIAYPLFLIAFVISIPFNVVGWLFLICELVSAFVQYIFIGDFDIFNYSTIGHFIIRDFYFHDLMIVVFPSTMKIISAIDDFNETLYPIKRS